MVSIGRLSGVCVLLLTVFSFALDASRAQPRRPNILLIVADDLGYADLGVHGSRDVRTPNIDALAAAGIRFTDAYVTGPYCSPTRAALLTGRYQQRFGHEFNAVGGSASPAALPLSERTLADRLKGAGYQTAMFGKWHLGAGPGRHPMDRGFDQFFGFLGGAHSYLEVGAATANPLLDGRSPAAGVTYLTDMFTDRAVAFLDRERSQPFFLYLAYNAVHTPMHATEPYLARFAHIADERRRTYAAMLAAMDDGVGRVMATLRKRQLEENTLVFFFSDNGGPTMAGTTINGASNAPLRGSKRQTYEGGIRVPFIVHWKGRLGASRVDRRPIIQLDVFPTALAAAGVTVDPAWRLDGVNLLPFLTGNAAGRPHDVLYWRLGGTMAIRKGDWKLVKTAEGPLAAVGNPSRLNDLSDAELFHLANDIGETKNLAASQPDVARDLAAAWQRWNSELAAPLWDPAGRGGPLASTSGVAQSAPPKAVAMQDLTVPKDRLPTGCALAASGALRHVMNPPKGMTANPWIGTDRTVLAVLRSHIDGPGLRRPLPDAIFTQPEESALKSKLADGVAEGYAASYEQPWAGNLVVEAVRFAVTPERRPDISGLNTKTIRIEIGSTWILFARDRGACSAAIEAHLKSLTK